MKKKKCPFLIEYHFCHYMIMSFSPIVLLWIPFKQMICQPKFTWQMSYLSSGASRNYGTIKVFESWIATNFYIFNSNLKALSAILQLLIWTIHWKGFTQVWHFLAKCCEMTMNHHQYQVIQVACSSTIQKLDKLCSKFKVQEII